MKKEHIYQIFVGLFVLIVGQWTYTFIQKNNKLTASFTISEYPALSPLVKTLNELKTVVNTKMIRIGTQSESAIKNLQDQLSYENLKDISDARDVLNEHAYFAEQDNPLRNITRETDIYSIDLLYPLLYDSDSLFKWPDAVAVGYVANNKGELEENVVLYTKYDIYYKLIASDGKTIIGETSNAIEIGNLRAGEQVQVTLWGQSLYALDSLNLTSTSGSGAISTQIPMDSRWKTVASFWSAIRFLLIFMLVWIVISWVILKIINIYIAKNKTTQASQEELTDIDPKE